MAVWAQLLLGFLALAVIGFVGQVVFRILGELAEEVMSELYELASKPFRRARDRRQLRRALDHLPPPA